MVTQLIAGSGMRGFGQYRRNGNLALIGSRPSLSPEFVRVGLLPNYSFDTPPMVAAVQRGKREIIDVVLNVNQCARQRLYPT
jgi:hypothetical protein